MAEERMEPLERLLNLVGLLLETRTPLTFDQIREMLAAYGADNIDSAKRMFERDKDVLRDWGVPLELVDVDAWGTEQGYVIRKETYYLPEIALTPEEITALFVAAQSGREETAVEQGVRKLLYGAEGGLLARLAGGPLVAGSDARSDLVVAAADAAQRHRRITFGYRTAQGTTSERDVDVYGIVFRGGHWYVIGHDRERRDIRAFRLSRCTTPLTDAGEGSDPPDGFRASHHVQAAPWEPGGDERAIVAFSRDVAWLAAESFAGADEGSPRFDGRVEVSIPFADEGAMAALVLQHGPDAEVIEPPTLREEVIRRLRTIVDD
jgi:proteasome accessory factor B